MTMTCPACGTRQEASAEHYTCSELTCGRDMLTEMIAATKRLLKRQERELAAELSWGSVARRSVLSRIEARIAKTTELLRQLLNVQSWVA